ncbi:MAG: protein-methionine-sulfoxide reductase heme-binding subunit MsrQ [Granulosicoccaceae bacterium]
MDTTLQNSSTTAASKGIWARRWWSKPLVFVAALIPLASLVYSLFDNQLGPNPIEELTHETGEWALRFIVLGLALTPLRVWIKKPWPVQLRRMIGLFAFFYAAMHFSIYMFLDQQLDLAAIVADVFKRPYISAGTVAFLILLPLAITSNRSMVKRLGKKWASLHRWVYIAACAAVVHYVWLAKGDRFEPFVYLAIVMALLMVRLKRVIA